MVFLLSLCAALWASCDNSKNPTTGSDIAQSLSFSANSLRMMDSKWQSGDAIGVFMLPNGASLAEGTQRESNACFQTTEDNTPSALFTARSTADQITLPESEAVDFMAYYPFEAAFASQVKKEIEYIAGSPLPDFLYSASAKNITRSANAGKVIPLQFRHVMSEVVVNLFYKDNTPVQAASVQLTDLQLNGSFSLVDGVVGNPSASVKRGDIALQKKQGTTNSYTAILIPTAKGEQTLFSVQIDGKRFTYTPPIESYEAGKRYTFNLKLNQDQQLELLRGVEGIIQDRDTGESVSNNLFPDQENEHDDRPNAANNWKGESGTTTSSAHIKRLEMPRPTGGANNWYVTHSVNGAVNYSLEYDVNHKGPRFVAFTFDEANKQNNTQRTKAWSWDPFIPQKYAAGSSSNNFGYKGSGYSRGHMVASADRLSSAAANKQTFYYTNMSPQLQPFNGGVWEQLESLVQDWGHTATATKIYYVAKGAVLDGPTVKGKTTSGITIPKYYWMAILISDGANYYSIAFLMDHDKPERVPKGGRWSSYAMSVNELEEFTGVDLFFNLPDSIEESIEGQNPVNYTSVWGNIF